MEVNDSSFDVNERLIRHQSEDIKFLRDEINNKNLIIKTLLKVSMIKISLIVSVLIILIIRLKIQSPKTNNSLNLRKQVI